MKQNKTYLKVAKDMYISQFIWTVWFLSIMLIVNIFNIVIAIFKQNEVDLYYNAAFIAANIFMLVVGIVSVFFLKHFLFNGVTRKDFFKGSLLASIGISVTIPIISIIVSTVLQFVTNFFIAIQFKTPNMSFSVEGDSHIIADMLTAFILSPYVNPNSNVLLSLAVFSINIFIFYLLGALVCASFMRLNEVGGLVFIVIAVNLLLAKDIIMRSALNTPVLFNISLLENVPIAILTILVLCIILFTILMIRLLTRRVVLSAK